LKYQLAPLLHQPRLQHLGLDLDVVGVSLRTRRPSMLRAQMSQVLQPRHILIELAIGSPLDHALRRQQIDVLPRATEVPRQLVAGHQHSRMGRTVAPLATILRRKFGHGSILLPTAPGWQRRIYRRVDILTACRRAGPALPFASTGPGRPITEGPPSFDVPASALAASPSPNRFMALSTIG
jgi:hypothetical protein